MTFETERFCLHEGKSIRSMINAEKSVVIRNQTESNRLRRKIVDTLSENVSLLRERMDTTDALSFFKAMKFEYTVLDPLTGEKENLIEVINQCQTYLVSLMAVEYLLEQYPETGFTVNMGNVGGYDIVSEDESVIAECFAATNYRSNQKLTKDLRRLSDNKTAVRKYEFFYDRAFTERHRAYYETRYPGIALVAFDDIR